MFKYSKSKPEKVLNAWAFYDWANSVSVSYTHLRAHET